jgi:hypothetical protein
MWAAGVGEVSGGRFLRTLTDRLRRRRRDGFLWIAWTRLFEKGPKDGENNKPS